MGKLKKEKNRVANTGGNAEKAGNLRVKGENFYRDAKKVKFVNMLKGGTAIRNSKGEIVREADFQSKEKPTARIAPNRKWFGMYLKNNYKVVSFLHPKTDMIYLKETPESLDKRH